MADSQQFKAATDFLKKSKDVDITTLSGVLGQSRQTLYNIRRGSQDPSAKIIKVLISEFPETAKFFEKKTKLNEDGNGNSVNSALERLADEREARINDLKALLEMKDKEIGALREGLAKAIAGVKRANAFIEKTISFEELAKMRAEFEREWEGRGEDGENGRAYLT